MPLSENELQTLHEMECALAADDPTFAGGFDLERARRRGLHRAAALFLIGVVVALLGLAATTVVLGAGVVITVAGLLAMAAAAFLLPAGRPRDEGPVP